MILRSLYIYNRLRINNFLQPEILSVFQTIFSSWNNTETNLMYFIKQYIFPFIHGKETPKPGSKYHLKKLKHSIITLSTHRLIQATLKWPNLSHQVQFPAFSEATCRFSNVYRSCPRQPNRTWRFKGTISQLVIIFSRYFFTCPIL